ncbi:MAG TPA: hypothetical protein VGL58_21205 [Caulobacteraceae bacterium]|jgi:hypothetical protein
MNRNLSRLACALAASASLSAGAASAQPASDYGAREPRPCPSRTMAGAPSAHAALALFVCDMEKYANGDLYLVANAVVQIGKSRPYSSWYDSGHGDIDVSRAVYPIQGHYTAYQCTRHDRMLGQDPARNCIRTDVTQATGVCYLSTFGEWHCGMIGTGAMMQGLQPPPDTN